MYHLIKEEQVRLGRPLRVCEIGVDRGQMRRYMQDAGFTDIACWEAVDYKLQPELMESGYTKQIQANVDLPDFNLAEKYDVIIVLHLLGHLFKPEQLVSKLSPALVSGGVLIGGFPTVPQLLQAYRQKKSSDRRQFWACQHVFTATCEKYGEKLRAKSELSFRNLLST